MKCQNYFYDVFKYRFIKNEALLLFLCNKNKNLYIQNNEKKNRWCIISYKDTKYKDHDLKDKDWIFKSRVLLLIVVLNLFVISFIQETETIPISNFNNSSVSDLYWSGLWKIFHCQKKIFPFLISLK